MTTDQGSRSGGYGGGYRPGGRPGGGSGGPRDKKGRPRFIPRRKVCSFCVDKVKAIDYKSIDLLKRYLSDRARIEPKRKTGTCARHQRMLTESLKRARHLALLPYTLVQVLESGMELGPQRRPFIRRDDRDFRGERSMEHRGERPASPPAERPAASPTERPVESKGEKVPTLAPKVEAPAAPVAAPATPAPKAEKAEKPKAERATKPKAAKTE